MRPTLQHGVQHDGAGGLGKRGELAQRVLGVLLLALRVHADEDDVLEAQLPILDLGDVLELGRQAGDAAQRGALLAVPLLAVRVGRAMVDSSCSACAAPKTRTPERASARASTRATGSTGISSVLWGLSYPSCVPFEMPVLSELARPVEVPVNSNSPRGGAPPLRSTAMGSDHYFSASPGERRESSPHPRARSPSREVEVTTAGGVFSPDHVDSGTAVLLANTPPPPPGGHLLDLGAGGGRSRCPSRMQSPHATVWAVDVNERALDLVRRNADALGARQCQRRHSPMMFPTTSSFRTIRSNPPIRVGKHELHGLLERWIPRLDERSDAWLVVQRNLGSDSLQRWLAATFDAGLQRAPRGDGPRLPRAEGAAARLAPTERAIALP